MKFRRMNFHRSRLSATRNFEKLPGKWGSRELVRWEVGVARVGSLRGGRGSENIWKPGSSTGRYEFSWGIINSRGNSGMGTTFEVLGSRLGRRTVDLGVPY